MKEKWTKVLPLLFVVVFTLTRWPGLMPSNFSAAYALAFCAGVYFPGRLAWWLPLGALLVSDLALNLYYFFVLHIDAFRAMQFVSYFAYALLIWLGKRFNSSTSLLKLLGGGVLGSLLFYLITNTASWFFNPFQNPEYTRNFTGWIVALSKGTAGYPQTWEFLRNTIISGGLFTGLFVGAFKLSASAEQEDCAEEEGEANVEEGAAEESKA
jgi:hypothetical protein